jgi:hypothetical protein
VEPEPECATHRSSWGWGWSSDHCDYHHLDLLAADDAAATAVGVFPVFAHEETRRAG